MSLLGPPKRPDLTGYGESPLAPFIRDELAARRRVLRIRALCIQAARTEQILQDGEDGEWWAQMYGHAVLRLMLTAIQEQAREAPSMPRTVLLGKAPT